MAKPNDPAFDKHLSHMFPAVSSQVDVGLYTAKRIPNFLEKMALLTLTYAQDLQKITSHEQGKGDKAQQDQATNHVFGYQKVQHVVGYMSSQLQQFSHRLMTEVIEPLTQLHNESVKKREKIVDRERKYSADIKAAEQEVTQRRITCLKSWRSLQSTQLERDEMENKMRSDPKKKSKFDDLQADLQKQQNKTLIEFKRFEEHLSTVTQQEVAYHTQLMPGLLKELESLEQTRLLAIETYVARFGKLFRDMFEPFEQYCAGLDRDVAQMNAQQTMVAFANGLVSQFGEPPAPTSMLQDLPCDSVTLATADPVKLRELLSGNISNLLESNGVSAASASESMFGQFSSFLGFASERKSSTAVDNKPAVKPPADDDAAAKATNALRNLVIPPEDPQGCDIVRAVFDFDGKEPDDVDFKVHDLIRVLTRPEDSNDENIKNGEWWIGRVLGARALNRRADGKMERVFVDGTFPSNYVEKLTIGPNIVLRHLLELNGGRFLFHEFLKSEYSQENLDFWVKVEEYRNKALGIEIAIDTGIAEFGDDAAVVVSARQQLEGVNAMAREIFQNYVANNAPDQININSANRQGITQRIQELGTSSTEHKDSDLFDAAQVEIFRLLSSDSFMRFKKSPYWFRMLKLYEGM